MSTLKTLLAEVKKELTEKDKARQEAQEEMRKATSLSKQAILLIHQKRQREAMKLIETAKEILADLRRNSTANPEIMYGGMYSAALQEYSEANIFLKLVQERKFVTPREIDVPSMDYVLGLADVIGECRRFALDALRQGDVETAEKSLQIMDQIYMELLALDESYMMVPGLRRKSDVARKVIEITRGDVTQEIRRGSLEKHLIRLEKSQERRTRRHNSKHLDGTNRAKV